MPAPLQFVPVARAPRGKGPRTKKQARRLRDRLIAEQLANGRTMVSRGVFK